MGTRFEKLFRLSIKNLFNNSEQSVLTLIECTKISNFFSEKPQTTRVRCTGFTENLCIYGFVKCTVWTAHFQGGNACPLFHDLNEADTRVFVNTEKQFPSTKYVQFFFLVLDWLELGKKHWEWHLTFDEAWIRLTVPVSWFTRESDYVNHSDETWKRVYKLLHYLLQLCFFRWCKILFCR